MALFEDVKIKTKLFASFAVLAVLVVLVNVVDYNGIKKATESADQILDTQVPIVDFSMELAINLITSRDLLGKYLSNDNGLDELEKAFNEAIAGLRKQYSAKDNLLLGKEEQDKLESIGKKIAEYEKAAREMLVAHRESVRYDKESAELMEKLDAQVDPLLEKAKAAQFTLDEFAMINELVMRVNDYIISESQQEKAAFSKVDAEVRGLSKFPRIAPLYNKVHEVAKQAIAAVDKHVELREAAQAKMKKADKISSEMEKIGEKLKEEATANMSRSMEVTDEVQTSSFSLQFALTLICVALVAFMAVTIFRGIANGSKKMVSKAEDITLGEGELTCGLEADNNNERGDRAEWFNQFVEKLHDIVLQVKGPSEKVAPGSRQIATGNQDLFQHSQEQASAIEETASIINQMAAKIKTDADNSQKTNDISQKVTEVAKRGGVGVQKNEASITEMPASSKKIGHIINVVNEIAFQSNLLALNAAVEAARVGKQDRGFAMMAGETRNPTERSAEATRENQAVINDGRERVKEGNRLEEETGRT